MAAGVDRGGGAAVIWERVPYDDGDGHYWRRKLYAGEEVYVDSLVRGEWVASWFSGGHDVAIGTFAGEDAAKAGAEHWLRVRVTAWENALAQVEFQDDGE